MRIVAGELKGRRLQAPRGMETRPTSDKVREAIFSILAGTFVGEPVLDLFAGTGALGIEALSRGAARAVFVERGAHACRCIRQNLESLHVDDRGKLLCMPAERALTLLDEPFGLILLDPPYAYPDVHRIMVTVSGAPVVGCDTMVVFEHSPRVSLAARYGNLAVWRHKVYGDTAVSIFVVQEDLSG
jgi:16S rRNA (guanine966-N2)-methyltransferase